MLSTTHLFKSVTPAPGNVRLKSVAPHICYSLTFIPDVVARIERRCLIEAKHVLLVCQFVLTGAEAIMQFFQHNFNALTEQKDIL